MWHDKLDKLRCLVQIFLLGDVVQLMVAIGRSLALDRLVRQIQDCRESHRSDMEWNKPNGEDLGHIHIELEFILIKC